MPLSSTIPGAVAVAAITVGLALGQQGPPADIARQPLDDAWWTGPMLAPSANTLPRGHFLLEPYVYDVITQGFYDSHRNRVSLPHQHEFGSLTYMNYGLFDNLTLGLIPTFDYIDPSNAPGSAGIRVGDLTLQAQYRLHRFREGSGMPTMSIAVQQTLPTGEYDQLGSRASNAAGSGAFTTTPSFYSQTFFWMPNGRILRMRFNVAPSFSRQVKVHDISIYGTSQGFHGYAKPGASVFVDLAGEYSMTRHWVLALDATYRYQVNTAVRGYNVLTRHSPVQLNSGISDAFGLAPAIEYNSKNNLGVLVGVRLIPSGRNTTDTITPALAINFVH